MQKHEKKSPLTLLPLGGLGEIGMNCLYIECEGSGLLIDCGVTFPSKDEGVDVYHPSFEPLRDRLDNLEALILTHGHEDHLGAVEYLLELKDLPIYAPKYSKEQLIERFDDRRKERPEILLYQHGRSFGVGAFEIEAYRVHHSAPYAHGLVIRGPFGSMIHSGDFKIEERPTTVFDWEIVDRAADEGVDLLLSDSTNVEVEGRSGSELDVAEELIKAVKDETGRVVIALFGSNILRLDAVIRAARATNRRLALLGRSVETHARLGLRTGELEPFDDIVVSAEDAMKVPRHRLLAVATGSQGERLAALPRIARGNHHDLDLAPGDTVILSSRIIPGAELAVYDLINELIRKGVKVVDRKDLPDIHVSGHATREELRIFLDRVRPAAFMPAHGTRRHLEKHAVLARECGIDEVKVFENGDLIELSDGRLRRVDQLPVGRVARHMGIFVPSFILRDRERLGEYGIVICAIPIDRDERMAAPVTIQHRGALFEAAPEEYLEEIATQVERRIRRMEGAEAIEDEARRTIQRYLRSQKPRAALVHAFAMFIDG